MTKISFGLNELDVACGGKSVISGGDTGRSPRLFKMFTAMRKIQKDKGVETSEFEESVAQSLFDLENGSTEIKSDLKDIYINTAVQVDVSSNRKAVVIHVPYRLRKAFRKIHVKLVRELEKKFSGKVS
ncbi:40S ribosomal protein S7 [Thalictrum thalictroides]|uniref:40S ribosomal protein S7 n=1 Tax=Thalictrum thalictroides TaxID=46969 RepID=A0A7J6XF92_THATH|nr:40S ribosomal protein S7 [Thalictrum thalictroides]